MDNQREHLIIDTIMQRFSCRVYEKRAIATTQQENLQTYMDGLARGPFGTTARFKLVAYTDEDQQALRGLGTYGFIRNAAAFIVGAIQPGEKDLEDYGYLMESIILKATGLELGTCWLGGTFTQSSFARKMGLREDELLPAVTSLGYIADGVKVRHTPLRRSVRADRRFPWEHLFFQGQFGNPLSTFEAGEYTIPLEMVRLGPSASNKQPWRVIKQGNAFHFYLQRTKGYGKGSLIFQALGLADLQRVDLGIALCHFELTARSLGLQGMWHRSKPPLELPDEAVEYTASWQCA